VGLPALTGVGVLAAYGELYRQLFNVGGARVNVVSLQGINFAHNAVSTTVPVVGGAGSIGYPPTGRRFAPWST